MRTAILPLDNDNTHSVSHFDSHLPPKIQIA